MKAINFTIHEETKTIKTNPNNEVMNTGARNVAILAFLSVMRCCLFSLLNCMFMVIINKKRQPKRLPLKLMNYFVSYFFS